VFVSTGAFAQSPIADPELNMAVTWMYENGLTRYDNPTSYNPMGTLDR